MNADHNSASREYPSRPSLLGARVQQGDRFIRIRELTRKIGLGKTTIYKLVLERSFPVPIKQGRTTMWLESEVERWMAERASASRASTRAGVQQ